MDERKKQYDKTYREKNKERLAMYKKEWYKNNREAVLKRHSQPFYKEKRNRRTILKRRELSSFVNRYKLFCGCKKCGYKKCPEALAFHHKDPKVKESDISRMVSNIKTLIEIKNEIRKCVVLCANCHIEEHLETKETLNGKKVL